MAHRAQLGLQIRRDVSVAYCDVDADQVVMVFDVSFPPDSGAPPFVFVEVVCGERSGSAAFVVGPPPPGSAQVIKTVPQVRPLLRVISDGVEVSEGLWRQSVVVDSPAADMTVMVCWGFPGDQNPTAARGEISLAQLQP